MATSETIAATVDAASVPSNYPLPMDRIAQKASEKAAWYREFEKPANRVKRFLGRATGHSQWGWPNREETDRKVAYAPQTDYQIPADAEAQLRQAGERAEVYQR